MFQPIIYGNIRMSFPFVVVLTEVEKTLAAAIFVPPSPNVGRGTEVEGFCRGAALGEERADAHVFVNPHDCLGEKRRHGDDLGDIARTGGRQRD
jgi:hypothetical protein